MSLQELAPHNLEALSVRIGKRAMRRSQSTAGRGPKVAGDASTHARKAVR